MSSTMDKFMPPKDPLQLENRLHTLQALPNERAKQLENALNQMAAEQAREVQTIEKLMAMIRGRTVQQQMNIIYKYLDINCADIPVFVEAQGDAEKQAAIHSILSSAKKFSKSKLEGYGLSAAHLAEATAKGKSEQKFVSDFWSWLNGKSNDADHKKTPWGRHPIRLPDVLAYEDSFIDVRYKFLKKMIHLQTFGPSNLNECFLFFKYIVRGDIGDKAGLGFLDDWDKITSEFVEITDDAGVEHFISPNAAQFWPRPQQLVLEANPEEKELGPVVEATRSAITAVKSPSPNQMDNSSEIQSSRTTYTSAIPVITVPLQPEAPTPTVQTVSSTLPSIAETSPSVAATTEPENIVQPSEEMEGIAPSATTSPSNPNDTPLETVSSKEETTTTKQENEKPQQELQQTVANQQERIAALENNIRELERMREETIRLHQEEKLAAERRVAAKTEAETLLKAYAYTENLKAELMKEKEEEGKKFGLHAQQIQAEGLKQQQAVSQQVRQQTIQEKDEQLRMEQQRLQAEREAEVNRIRLEREAEQQRMQAEREAMQARIMAEEKAKLESQEAERKQMQNATHAVSALQNQIGQMQAEREAMQSRIMAEEKAKLESQEAERKQMQNATHAVSALQNQIEQMRQEQEHAKRFFQQQALEAQQQRLASENEKIQLQQKLEQNHQQAQILWRQVEELSARNQQLQYQVEHTSMETEVHHQSPEPAPITPERSTLTQPESMETEMPIVPEQAPMVPESSRLQLGKRQRTEQTPSPIRAEGVEQSSSQQQQINPAEQQQQQQSQPQQQRRKVGPKSEFEEYQDNGVWVREKDPSIGNKFPEISKDKGTWKEFVKLFERNTDKRKLEYEDYMNKYPNAPRNIALGYEKGEARVLLQNDDLTPYVFLPRMTSEEDEVVKVSDLKKTKYRDQLEGKFGYGTGGVQWVWVGKAFHDKIMEELQK